jgi:hypothetical protein
MENEPLLQPCSRCGGTGYEEYEEDGRWIRDACYHCSNTGRVDCQTAFFDRIQSVAETLAWLRVHAMERERNADPEGEDWTFCAAENGCTAYDYSVGVAAGLTAEIAEDLLKRDTTTQEVLVAWNEYQP